MRIMTRFAVSMTLALSLVMAAAGVVLYGTTSRLLETTEQRTLREAVRLTYAEENREPPTWKHHGTSGRVDPQTSVFSMPIRYGSDLEGFVYEFPRDRREDDPEAVRLLVPGGANRSDQTLLGLIVGMILIVILVGAGVAMWVARTVAGPINAIVDDVRQISRGDLKSLGGVRGAAEVVSLARAIDRMTKDLETAQDAELELSVREREMELAGGVREALLPVTTPIVEGYDIGSSHLASPRFGGDFHDYVELADGRLGLLVCDVSGSGIPAALVGATARSYLRRELMQGDDLSEALRVINRELANDVRRGMFVTALYVLLDPKTARAQVACAGHKIPLVRYTHADQKLRLLHPEGIALGFDEGPVFERALRIETITLEPGDRLILSNSGPVRITNDAGEELGEKRFYGQLLKHAPLDTGKFLKGVKRVLEGYVGENGLPNDISIVTVQREA